MKTQPNKIKSILQPILWDYQIDVVEFYHIALGQRSGIGMLDQQKAFLRILERVSLYDIFDLFDLEVLKKYLTSTLIKKLRFPELQRKYEIIRKILHGEPISFPGWSAETRQRTQNTVLSNRWYSA